jgi:hypothetical protein
MLCIVNKDTVEFFIQVLQNKGEMDLFSEVIQNVVMNVLQTPGGWIMFQRLWRF